MQQAVYSPSRNSVITVIAAGADGAAAVAQYAAEYGADLIVLPLDEAARRYEDGFKTEVEEIGHDRWWYYLEVLPPVGWRNTGDGESFKLMERTAGNVTQICVRIGERYFGFQDCITLPHADCIARVKAHLEAAAS